MSDPPARGRSGWAYLGIGCLVVAGLMVLAGVGLGVAAWRWGADVKATQKDPRLRTEMALRLLGGERLPEGYHAVAAVSVPWVADIVVLSDRPSDERGEIDGFDERGFFFLRSLRFGPKREKLLDFFEGKDTRIRTGSWNFHFDNGEIVTRGRLEIHGRPVLYVVQRGDFEIQDNVREGLATMFITECPDDPRARLGIWFGPDPAPGTPTADVDLTGSPGDESVLGAFASGFDPCAS